MPDGLALIQSAGDDVTFIMPESDVLLTGRFVENPPEPVVYTITYHSGLEPGDEGYTAALGESHDFPVTAGADGKVNHKVLVNDSDELRYVREGYTFAGWKLTKAQPDPNPAPGDSGTVVAPRVLAANGLYSGGDVVTVDSSVILTAQWTKKLAPDPEKKPETPFSPGTGEGVLPVVLAYNLAILSMLAIGMILRRRSVR